MLTTLSEAHAQVALDFKPVVHELGAGIAPTSSLTFTDVKFTLTDQQKILGPISGSVPSGSVLAVIGFHPQRSLPLYQP